MAGRQPPRQPRLPGDRRRESDPAPRAAAPAQRPLVHHFLPHAVPRVRPRPDPGAALAQLRTPAALPRCRRPHAGGDALDAPCPRGARFRQPRAVEPRRRHEPVPAGAEAVPRPAEANLALLRAGRRREGHRGLPRARPARNAARGRRRPRARRLPPPVSRCCLRGLQVRRGAGSAHRRLRRVRVPEPNRHVRPRAARGDGLRRAGDGAGGRGRRRSDGRARPRPACRCARRWAEAASGA